MAINLCESFRAMFYTPFYLPFALGTYEAEGVDVTLSTSPSLDTVAEQLRDGIADVYWGGPMRIMVMRDRIREPEIIGFSEAITRDPFFLIGKTPNPSFDLKDLLDIRFASVSEVPTPWMCLQEDLRRAGIDPASLNRNPDRSMPENVEALANDKADVIQLFQPFAEQVLSSGAGHLWYAQAARGYCTYTTLYATKEMIASRPDDMHRMTRAMYRCQKWIHAVQPSEIASAVAEFFPDISADILSAAAARYVELGVWGKDPHLPREGFERLRDSLVSGGLISIRPEFEDCVENQFADAVIAEDPPKA
ncbi:MAG: ABC transporter substrate-binding protein [Alphaproteobacteria bacterium]|jgi:NitT/TauT family transport system substrate-binding protein|nr:ABC transporter substrate-binding protein [Alphaproteobacteria bacterium]MEC7648967.1 ABC transporter substrate-binding protein [Pseudomonadota bacterium]